MDIKYWNEYYKTNAGAFHPSPFAEFCMKNYINQDDIILDIGCGNGRDTIYFANNGCKILGVDQSIVGIELAKNYKNIPINLKLEFNALKVEQLQTLDPEQFTVVYARFFLHALKESEQWKLLEDVLLLLKRHGKFMFEVRTTNDELYGTGDMVGTDEYFTDHYRRFINTNRMLNRILNFQYKIIYFIEDVGLAKYQDENPSIGRFVLVKR